MIELAEASFRAMAAQLRPAVPALAAAINGSGGNNANVDNTPTAEVVVGITGCILVICLLFVTIVFLYKRQLDHADGSMIDPVRFYTSHVVSPHVLLAVRTVIGLYATTVVVHSMANNFLCPRQKSWANMTSTEQYQCTEQYAPEYFTIWNYTFLALYFVSVSIMSYHLYAR